ncbi:porin family protein [Coralloluteibacterium stylophorae]|uniref:Porin family protein n=1 Tax=Coralloluteibacterium stylophorae TaxID=1776034 RepID=A0A8J7VT28_9GAMM|nr:porin family protein [Coralloluteibacterium stylophorae]MBS7457447.1 porin family protein [Coralloluteibacterium stylophorae]
MSPIRILVPALALALALPVAAQAAERGFYAGGKVGAASYDDDFLDEDDTSFGVYGGFQFNPYFALEGSYTNFGDIEGSLTPPDLGTGSVEPRSFGVAAIGMLPIGNQFSLLASAGLQSWEANPDDDLEDVVGDRDSTDPFYGVGAQFDFTSNVSLRAQYQRYEFGDADNDEVSLGLHYTFR